MVQEFALTAAITSLYNNVLSCYDWQAQLDSLMASMKVTEPGDCTLLSEPRLPGAGSKLCNTTTAVLAVRVILLAFCRSTGQQLPGKTLFILV